MNSEVAVISIRDAMLYDIADALGVRVEYVADLQDDGRYFHDRRLIMLRRGMHARHHRSAFAHEVAHAVFEDEPSMFESENARQERRAEEWAAQHLITPDAYRAAEVLHDGHAGAMALELEVMRSTVEAYRSVLLRAGSAVYVRPRMGVGQWDYRELVA